mmetsp:Transcript_61479/g.165169  ORF Transcript_61479/g.165169 Transcript_61479/m.165169 type:complete len:133 (+) Transcript_61479:438-836(+)
MTRDLSLISGPAPGSQSLHATRPPPLPVCNGAEDLEVVPALAGADGVASPVFRNRRTNSEPAVLHFNGGSKKLHLHFDKLAWYRRPEHNTANHVAALRAFRFAAPMNGGFIALADICGKHLDSLQAASKGVR